MTLFDNALGDMEALLQCPLWDCIYPVLGVKCRCPTCGLPAIVKNLLRNPSYDTLVACTLKIMRLREAGEGEIEDHEDEDDTQSIGHATSHQQQLSQLPPATSTMQGTVLWSYDCGPTFPDTSDVSTPTATGSATTTSTFPSVNALMSRHIRDRHANEEAAVSATDDNQPVTDGIQQPLYPTSDTTIPASDNTTAEGAPSEQMQMLRQILGMPAWKATDRLATEELTQQTRASTAEVGGDDHPNTSETPRMPSPALGGYGTYVAVAKDDREPTYTSTDAHRDKSPGLPEPLPSSSRKRRIVMQPDDHAAEGQASSKRSSATARKGDGSSSSRIPRHERSQQPTREFRPQATEPTSEQPHPNRSSVLSFLPLKGQPKLTTAKSLDSDSVSVPLLRTHQQKSKAPVAVAIRRNFDIDQDIMSRVVDMDDREYTAQYERKCKDHPEQEQKQSQQHGELEDEHPSLSHDDIWRCEWCKNINLMYISNEPNNLCDHCHKPKEDSPPPHSTTTAAVARSSKPSAPQSETIPPSDGEEEEPEKAHASKAGQDRTLDVIGSSQFSLDVNGLTMPSRHSNSTMASLPESQGGKEEVGDAFHLLRQNAAISSSSANGYNSNGSQRHPRLQDTVGASEPSLSSSTGSQQQQQSRMVCCIFTGLKSEHRHAFDDNTTKLVEADLLMEQIADQDVSERTTHIVTSVDEEPGTGYLLCPRVRKYMYGMLSPPSVWIVRYEWFENSIHQRQWLPLPAMREIYEVQGDTQFGPAPRVHERRQRRSQLGKKLFDGCKMFFYGDFTHKSSFRKQDILRLVQYGGATILSRKPPKATVTNPSLMATSGGGSGTQTTIGSPSRSGSPLLSSSSSSAAIRAEAAQYFAPDVPATGRKGRAAGSGDERPFLYVTEDIQPWQVPLDRQQPLIVCDPYSIPGKSVGGASTAVAVLMDRLTPAERKKHGWLTTGGYQAVSATWLLNCISCSLFGKGDMQALYSRRTVREEANQESYNGNHSPTSEEMLQELEDAWRRWRSSSSSSTSSRRPVP
ncbi:hypothetical protein BGZ73_006559 [Actinomortierella ambigua]|nr:hypothetical protein BGZ73_006559 [Actinomortierella ambigua]